MASSSVIKEFPENRRRRFDDRNLNDHIRVFTTYLSMMPEADGSRLVAWMEREITSAQKDERIRRLEFELAAKELRISVLEQEIEELKHHKELNKGNNG